jgi:antitoxin component YwqK of YwqJK toxin-antitoxin module
MIVNREENGVKQGLWIEPDGSRHWLGYYDNGSKTGSWNFFENHRLVKTVRYVDDLKQGHGFKFGSEGNLLLAMEFDKDRVHGKVRFFSSDGQLITVYGYVYDKLNTVELYVLHDESPPKDKTYLPDF